MIANRHEIAAVRRSGEGELHITVGTVAPETGRTYALQPAVGRPAYCHAKVLDVWEHRDGGWVVIVTLVAKEVPPRYISRSGTHYTTDPGQAARDPETGQAEWSPPADWVDPGTEVREDYRRTLESDTIAALLPDVTDWEGYVRLKQIARSRGVDISSDLRVIEARLERIGKRLKKDAA